MSFKLTKKHSELFDLYVKKWQKLFNLNDWRIIKNNRDTKSMAELYDFDDIARAVNYRLSKTWNEEPTPLNLEKTAIHETAHLRLHEYGQACAKHGSTSEEAYSAEHAIVTVLEEILIEYAELKRCEEGKSV